MHALLLTLLHTHMHLLLHALAPLFADIGDNEFPASAVAVPKKKIAVTENYSHFKYLSLLLNVTYQTKVFKQKSGRLM